MTPAVPGELRGYRRFQVSGGRLLPVVHTADGAWAPGVHQARCALRRSHAVPDAACGCGLYAWYHPSEAGAASGYGDVTAVVAASGRIVLAEDGFRAERARVVAVAAGTHSEHTRRALLASYPGVELWTSRRRMLRRYPPEDLSALGVDVRPTRASRVRAVALAVWLVGVAALYSLVVLPPGAVSQAPDAAWAAALVVFVLWQAALVALTLRSTPEALRHTTAGSSRAR